MQGNLFDAFAIGNIFQHVSETYFHKYATIAFTDDVDVLQSAKFGD